MTQVTINAKTREKTSRGAMHQLRQSGMIPAVLYGKDVEPQAIAVSDKVFTGAGSALHNELVKLQVNETSHDAMIKDIQRHPITQNVLHVDFHRVDITKPIVIRVPLHLTGTEEVEQRRRGIVQQQTREIEVQTLPTKAPEYLVVDISDLDIGDNVHVSDVKLPEGVELRSDETEVVVSVLGGRRQTSEDLAQDQAEAAEQGE